MSSGSDQPNGFYISAANLLLEYRHFIDSHEPLSILNQAYPVWPSMVNYCQELETHTELMQAITKLHSRSQIDFERGMFCSWMSLLLAKSQNLAEPHQRSLFIAGLLQDLGKHAVEEEVKGFVSRVNAPFMSMASDKAPHDLHPLVSSTYVERILSDRTISDLILHHHARYDGTGYPQHLSESQLDIDHQILIIANEINDRLDGLGGHNHLASSIPMLQLSSFLYFNKAYMAWFELLSNNFAMESEFENTERAVLVLRSRKQKLEKLLACLISLSGELLRYDFDLCVHGLRSIIQKLAHMFTDSGILNKHIFKEDELSASVLLEMEMVFKGMPDVLSRCKEFVEEILRAKNLEINSALLSEANALLSANIADLGGRRASIFR